MNLTDVPQMDKNEKRLVGGTEAEGACKKSIEKTSYNIQKQTPYSTHLLRGEIPIEVEVIKCAITKCW